jgi:hypothetical protein
MRVDTRTPLVRPDPDSASLEQPTQGPRAPRAPAVALHRLRAPPLRPSSRSHGTTSERVVRRQPDGWFQRFYADGFLEEVWAYLLAECQELGSVSWEWQAADGVMGKSRFESAARGPTPLTEPRWAPRRASSSSSTVDPSGR